MISRSRIFFVILILAAILAVPPFIYKAVYCPIALIWKLDDAGQRRGDFWATFPAPFVKSYNPELREKTIVKEWDEIAPPEWGRGRWAYGPIQHLITLPLTFLKSIKLVSFIWFTANFVFLVAALVLILAVFRESGIYVKALMAFMWMGYWPVYIALQEDVIEIFELFIVILGLYLLRKRRNISAGVSLGMAAMTKFLPLIFIIYFLIKKNFKALLAMVATILVIGIGAQFTLGWQNSAMIHRVISDIRENRYDATHFRSQTIPSVIERYFGTTDYSAQQIHCPIVRDPVLAGKVVRYTTAVFFLFLVLMLVKKRPDDFLPVEYGLVSVFMILAPLHGQPYYLIFCLIGYSAALEFVCRQRYAFGACILVISYILSGILNQLFIFDALLFPAQGLDRYKLFYFLSFPAYGAMLLFGLLAIILRRAPSNVNIMR